MKTGQRHEVGKNMLQVKRWRDELSAPPSLTKEIRNIVFRGGGGGDRGGGVRGEKGGNLKIFATNCRWADANGGERRQSSARQAAGKVRIKRSCARSVRWPAGEA